MDYISPVIKQKLEIILDRSRKSIAQWINAYIIAEARTHPRRRELIDIFDYAMLDNHLKAVIRNRKNKVAGEKWQLVDDLGVTLEDETKLLNKAWFRKFIRLALDAKAYGYTLIELGDFKEGELVNVKDINRRNVNPDTHEILIRPSDIYGISFDDPTYADNYVFVDGQEGLGILLSAVPDVIYKRYAKAAWTEHAENFTLPFLQAKTDLQDSEKVENLKQQILNAGRDRTLMTGHDDEITAIAEAASTDVHKIYDELIERSNGELSKLVLGQTMTTDDGSSKSQGEVHERVSDQIAKDDRDFIEDVVNDQLLPKLIALGYPLEGSKFTYNLSKEATTEEKVKVFDLLLKHYKIKPNVIKETFAVDVEEKEEIEMPAGGKYKGTKEIEKKGKF